MNKFDDGGQSTRIYAIHIKAIMYFICFQKKKGQGQVILFVYLKGIVYALSCAENLQYLTNAPIVR